MFLLQHAIETAIVLQCDCKHDNGMFMPCMNVLNGTLGTETYAFSPYMSFLYIAPAICFVSPPHFLL